MAVLGRSTEVIIIIIIFIIIIINNYKLQLVAYLHAIM